MIRSNKQLERLLTKYFYFEVVMLEGLIDHQTKIYLSLFQLRDQLCRSTGSKCQVDARIDLAEAMEYRRKPVGEDGFRRAYDEGTSRNMLSNGHGRGLVE
jgi:hypothetical protein